MAGTVQDKIATGILNQFHVSIGMNLVNKLQNWQSRQDIQYGAMKGLMNKDWHSLPDFKTQMTAYSAVSHTLRVAWALIRALVPNNAQMLATLIRIPGFGNVPLGRSVLSLVGIQNVLVTPQDILKNTNQFNSTIKSLS